MRNVMISSGLLLMLFASIGCEEKFTDKTDYGKKETCFWMILDGRGGEPLGPNGEDSFTLFQEMLSRPDRDFRGHAASNLSLNTFGAGDTYNYVIDGYIGAGRDDGLQAALHAAWKQEPDVPVGLHDTSTRQNIARAYLHLRRRQYCRAYPKQVATKFIERGLPGSYPRPGASFNREDHEFLNDCLIESGDEEYIEVMSDYRENYKGW